METDHEEVGKAFRVALGDYLGNILPWSSSPDRKPVHCILAGLDYDKPWTRDASLNSWFAGSLLTPEIARNTLLAVLTGDDKDIRIGGQYWDAIIWVTAAWNHYLLSGDKEFLQTAYQVTVNSLKYFEERELDRSDDLFRGGACFQDGISGYPDEYADGPSSCILDWVKSHGEERAKDGYGLTMKTLSTNCLYFNAYRLLPKMAKSLGQPADPHWKDMENKMRESIGGRFWNSASGTFRYMLGGEEDETRQEGLGHAFAILFGLADDMQCKSVFDRQYITPQGIPCVWPTYQRYRVDGEDTYGRHSGTVWPQVNSAWVMASSKKGRRDMSWKEIISLAEKACRDVHFAEIYHPETGLPYGGLQENPPKADQPLLWGSCRRQTWCATGYIQMLLSTLFGMAVSSKGLSFHPWLPDEISRIKISGLNFGKAVISISLEKGSRALFQWNGQGMESTRIPFGGSGKLDLRFVLQ